VIESSRQREGDRERGREAIYRDRGLERDREGDREREKSLTGIDG